MSEIFTPRYNKKLDFNLRNVYNSVIKFRIFGYFLLFISGINMATELKNQENNKKSTRAGLLLQTFNTAVAVGCAVVGFAALYSTIALCSPAIAAATALWVAPALVGARLAGSVVGGIGIKRGLDFALSRTFGLFSNKEQKKKRRPFSNFLTGTLASLAILGAATYGYMNKEDTPVRECNIERINQDDVIVDDTENFVAPDDLAARLEADRLAAEQARLERQRRLDELARIERARTEQLNRQQLESMTRVEPVTPQFRPNFNCTSINVADTGQTGYYCDNMVNFSDYQIRPGQTVLFTDSTSGNMTVVGLAEDCDEPVNFSEFMATTGAPVANARFTAQRAERDSSISFGAYRAVRIN